MNDGQLIRRLSPRQMQVLRLAADGLDYRHIAQALGCGDETARKHRKAIMKRLLADNMAHAVAIAFRAGLLT